MAETNKYADSELISIYCYVNKDTDIVDAILTFNLFGNAIRKDGDWQLVPRTDPELVGYLNEENYNVWKVDWSKAPIIDADPTDGAAWEHQLVQAWDEGRRLKSSDLKMYARKINVELESSNQE
jgi:hypothetical protein